MSLSDDLLQQRAQLSHLYEQKENLVNNITGLKQIIATLEYAIKQAETEKIEQPPTDSDSE
jgi:Asp-tRNA(Asn)/Glu-tRNA(Gln) amidotransferase C subunit